MTFGVKRLERSLCSFWLAMTVSNHNTSGVAVETDLGFRRVFYGVSPFV